MSFLTNVFFLRSSSSCCTGREGENQVLRPQFKVLPPNSGAGSVQSQWTAREGVGCAPGEGGSSFPLHTPVEEEEEEGGGMLQQAFLYARGLARSNHPAPSDPFPPLSPGRHRNAATCHCDILGRLLQEFSRETMANDGRANAHMARKEHSAIRRVRQRREGEASSSSHKARGRGQGRREELRGRSTSAR